MDINPITFVGPRDDGQTRELSTDLGLPADSSSYASGLKFSTSLQQFTLICNVIVMGGHDACVDVNNLCRNLDIRAQGLLPRGNFAATIKGGSQNVRLAGTLLGHGKMADIIIGDWSDQSHALTTGVHLALTSADDRPITVLVLKGERPTFEVGTGPYKFLFPWPWLGPLHTLIVWGFETLRRWGFFRHYAN